MVVIKQSLKNIRVMQLAGICGISGSLIVIVIVLLATVLSPWFSWQENALSQLGVGEVSLLFNGAVFVGGLLTFFFSFGVREYISQSLKTDLGVALLMLGSLCLALVGIFTIDFSLLHGLVSLGYFLFAPIGLFLIGFGIEDRTVKRLSIVTGSLALISILGLPIIFLVLPFEVGFAVPEIIHAIILGIWTINIAGKLLSFKN